MRTWHLWILTCQPPAHGDTETVSSELGDLAQHLQWLFRQLVVKLNTIGELNHVLIQRTKDVNQALNEDNIRIRYCNQLYHQLLTESCKWQYNPHSFCYTSIAQLLDGFQVWCNIETNSIPRLIFVKRFKCTQDKNFPQPDAVIEMRWVEYDFIIIDLSDVIG